MSRSISDPDLVDDNSLPSSFDSDFDEEFAPHTYPAITIYEQSTFYPSPLGKWNLQHRTPKHKSNDRGDTKPRPQQPLGDFVLAVAVKLTNEQVFPWRQMSRFTRMS
jgi:hypothetical protein